MATWDWSILIDWDGDGSFSYNEADRCSYLHVDIGREGPFSDMRAGKCTLRLENHDDRFDPWNAGSAIYPNVLPGRGVKISHIPSGGGTTAYIFFGYIEDIEPIGGLGDKQMVVTAYDGVRKLIGSQASIALQSSITVGTAIGLLLDEIGWGGGASWRYIESGDTIATWWCDQSGYQALLALTRSEQGFYVFAPSQIFYFFQRSTNHTPISGKSIDEGEMTDVQVTMPWQYIYNKVTVICQPIKIDVGAELWRLQDTGIFIQPGQSEIIWAQFHDAYDRPCPADNVVSPASTTDYTANATEGGGGTDMTASMGVSASIFSSAAKLTITNNHATAGFYIVLLKIRGDALTKEVTRITKEDAASQSAYGVRELEIDSPWLQSVNVAIDYANAILNIWKNPRKIVQLTQYLDPDVSLNDYFYPQNIGNHFAIDIPTYDISEVMRLGRIEMEATIPTLQMYRVTCQMEPLEDQSWWLLGDAGYSELGDTTRLGW